VTVRAMAVLVDGHVKMICGLAKELPNNRAFFDADPDTDIDVYHFKRAILEAMKWVRSSKFAVYAAVADERGARLQERLGFVHWFDDFNRWPA